MQQTYSPTILGEPSKTLHLPNLQRSASIYLHLVALAQPCFSLIVLEKNIIRRENQVFPILHDEGPTREITCPTVSANKIPNISPC